MPSPLLPNWRAVRTVTCRTSSLAPPGIRGTPEPPFKGFPRVKSKMGWIGFPPAPGRHSRSDTPRLVKEEPVVRASIPSESRSAHHVEGESVGGEGRNWQVEGRKGVAQVLVAGVH